MKQSFLFLVVLTLSAASFSQTAEYDATMRRFQKKYNEQDGQAVFDMMDANMQQSLSLPKLSAILDSFYTNFGIMESYQFETREGIVEVFLAQFEKGKQMIHIVANSEEKLSGLLFKPYDVEGKGKLDRNITKLQLPFKGEWFTYWGGVNKRQNYHVTYKPQQGAFDFIVRDKNGSSYQRSGTRNEDYYAFGKRLYAVCEAVVIRVVTGVEDNRPGEMNPAQAFGNYVVLRTANDEFIFYAHFQKESIKVKTGDVVKQGQYLGDCGNSGNSSEPHVHLHIQDGPNVLADIGARCFFESLIVNGTLEIDYSPVQGDVIAIPEK
jgi:murein DD-endopeptidase MepM/ murein hydrolase activator NlpD